MPIPVIDIFAGPGGLGEGFSALLNRNGERVFEIALSVEKEAQAHKTLTLRSFFRQFSVGQVPAEYYQFVRGEIKLYELEEKYPVEFENARKEAWCATLGESKGAVSNKEVDKRIGEALGGVSDWLLIGGPPCQAYSVVGRSRRQEKILNAQTDERVGLYKQYLRILAIHNPSVFVMENVKGLLSAKTAESPVLSRILADLSNPAEAYKTDFGNDRVITCPGYRVYSLTVKPSGFDLERNPILQQKDFLIYAEKFGVPQTRHRVILLGVRRDIDIVPEILTAQAEVPISRVLEGLPKLRSGLSKEENSGEHWRNVINGIKSRALLTGVSGDVKAEIAKQLEGIALPQKGTGAEYIPYDSRIDYEHAWFSDENLGGVCNHASRGHMSSDLHRYFFASCFAKTKKRSPKLVDFPAALLPEHENVDEGIEEQKFADRFRVQLHNKPAKTITSHISKDGHYYIHPDPKQCRSFTVREAARIQTFPDNYFFCGPRTSQFTQVGNAVPPLLANKISKIVSRIFNPDE
ncbi:DNA cytosine methyltransferase [Chitinophaga caseinilytica]|uniref:DNA cytosine methyltransferase n=1 Tax=Chitinophaga caseinilytica TaxID=2267521 RepID=UPI003C2B6292